MFSPGAPLPLIISGSVRLTLSIYLLFSPSPLLSLSVSIFPAVTERCSLTVRKPYVMWEKMWHRKQSLVLYHLWTLPPSWRSYGNLHLSHFLLWLNHWWFLWGHSRFFFGLCSFPFLSVFLPSLTHLFFWPKLDPTNLIGIGSRTRKLVPRTGSIF